MGEYLVNGSCCIMDNALTMLPCCRVQMSNYKLVIVDIILAIQLYLYSHIAGLMSQSVIESPAALGIRTCRQSLAG